MATKSPNSKHVEDVVRGVAVVLNTQGFRRTGCILRREVEPGFEQIIDVGLAPSWSILSGHFTVDICAFFAEAYEVFYSKPPPRRPSSLHCELRQRLGMLATPPADHWWQISGATDLLVSEVGRDIERLALPFFARIATRRSFVEEWFTFGNDALGMKPRGILTVAAVLAQLGDREGVEETLRRALAESVGKPFEAFYAESARKISDISTV